jgi:hypothetical protein
MLFFACFYNQQVSFVGNKEHLFLKIYQMFMILRIKSKSCTTILPKHQGIILLENIRDQNG